MLKKMVGEDESLTKKSKIDLSRIPPCKDSFIPHCQRVNHRLCSYKRAHQAIIEFVKPYEPDQGWTKKEGVVEPVWTIGDILPESLIYLLDSDALDLSDDEEEELEFEDIFDEDEEDD